jgi:pyrophosphatase PpaX
MSSGSKERRFTAILFDLDDTLLDSLTARTQALQRVFNAADITSMTAAGFLANLPGISFDAALRQLGIAEKARADLFTIYRRTYWLETHPLRLYPGVREMLEELRRQGLILGIVTAKARNVEFEGTRIGCLGELNEMGIAGFFKTVVGFEDVEKPKPHPEGVLLALKDLRAAPAATLLVGDSPSDIQAARAAGCFSCRAVWGIENRGFVDDTAADYTAYHPGDVFSIVSGDGY